MQLGCWDRRHRAGAAVVLTPNKTSGSNPVSSTGESGKNRAAAGDIRAPMRPLRNSLSDLRQRRRSPVTNRVLRERQRSPEEVASEAVELREEGAWRAGRDREFADSPLEGTGFELPVRGRGQSGCRPFYAAESSGRIKAAWTRPPRPQSVPATHTAEFCGLGTLVSAEPSTAPPSTDLSRGTLPRSPTQRAPRNPTNGIGKGSAGVSTARD
jgi:hypothetical protein